MADSSGSGNRSDIVAKQQASVLSWCFTAIICLVEDGEEWDDIIDPSFNLVAGEQPAIEKAHSFISGKSSSDSAHVEEGLLRESEMRGYVRMECCSEDPPPDDSEAPEAISRIDPQDSQPVLRPGGAQ